jgi:hypothetical protein
MRYIPIIKNGGFEMKTRVLFVIVISLSFLATCLAQEPSAAQMGMMEKLSQPGEYHQILEDFAGTWTANVSMWMAPDTPPIVTKGQATFKLIFGGRFLYGDFLGEFMGQPFKGINIMGYDNAKEQFFSIWLDNSTTGLISSTGTYDKNTKKFHFYAKSFDPMSGQTVEMRDEAYFASEDEYISVTYTKAEGGEEFKSMETKYTRVK